MRHRLNHHLPAKPGEAWSIPQGSVPIRLRPQSVPRTAFSSMHIA